MDRLKKFFFALAVIALAVPASFAADDLTAGPMGNRHTIPWGDQSVNIYGDASSGNEFFRIQTNGVDRLSIDQNGAVTLSGALNVTGQPNFTTNLSSFSVANATGVYTMTTLGQCISGSTITLTLPTSVSTIWVSYSGASSSTVVGSTITLGVIVDGGFATIANVAENANRGLITVGNGVGLGGNDLNMSFGPVPIKSLTAGATHNLCLTLASATGQVSFDSANELSVFTAFYLP